jgi:hypothetical protein
MIPRAPHAISSAFGALVRALVALVAIAAFGVQSVAAGAHLEIRAFASVADGRPAEVHPAADDHLHHAGLAHAGCAYCRALGMAIDCPPPPAEALRASDAQHAAFAFFDASSQDLRPRLGFRSRAPPG